MKNHMKYSALVTTTLLVAALAGPAQAQTPSTVPLDKVPTDTSQLVAVKADTTSQLKFERPAVTTTPAPKAVEPVADLVTVQAATVEVTPTNTAPSSPVATQAVSAPAVPKPQPSASGKGSAILSAAYGQLGIHQDCTALVSNALSAVGIHFHDWPAGYLSLGTVVPASQAQPGDLAYYVNGGGGMAHIAVYAGNGQAVHGGFNGNQTVVSSVNVGSGPIFIRVA